MKINVLLIVKYLTMKISFLWLDCQSFTQAGAPAIYLLNYSFYIFADTGLNVCFPYTFRLHLSLSTQQVAGETVFRKHTVLNPPHFLVVVRLKKVPSLSYKIFCKVTYVFPKTREAEKSFLAVQK